jgi:hypothetical protein
VIFRVPFYLPPIRRPPVPQLCCTTAGLASRAFWRLSPGPRSVFTYTHDTYSKVRWISLRGWFGTAMAGCGTGPSVLPVIWKPEWSYHRSVDLVAHRGDWRVEYEWPLPRGEPVGVGYSYLDEGSYIHSDSAGSAIDMHRFLQFIFSDVLPHHLDFLLHIS